MQNRLFAVPYDVFKDEVLNHLPTLCDRKSAIMSRSQSLQEAQHRFSEYLIHAASTSEKILRFIANLERRDIAWFLRKVMHPKSEQYVELQKIVHSDKANVLDDICYALVANVKDLDINKLINAVTFIQAHNRFARLKPSIEIVTGYLVEGSDGISEILGAHVDAAYVNLRGSRLTCMLAMDDDHTVIDLSYANLRESKFYAECGETVNLEGADCTDASFDHRTNLCLANTRGLILNRVKNRGYILAFDNNDSDEEQYVTHLLEEELMAQKQEAKCSIL